MMHDAVVDTVNADPRYRWAYVARKFTRSYVHKTRIKFIRAERRGSHSTDWVGGRAWTSPKVPLGPPAVGHGV